MIIAMKRWRGRPRLVPGHCTTVRACRIGWIVYVSATLLALWLPLLSFAAYLAIAVHYLVPRSSDA